MLRLCGRHYQVEPRCEPVAGTCDLDFDHGRGLLVVLTAQFLPNDGCWTLGEYCSCQQSAPDAKSETEGKRHGERREDEKGVAKRLTMRANVGISLARPTQCRGDGIGKVDTVQPGLALGRELTARDLLGELVGPRLGLAEGLPPHAADPPLGNARVPDVVQVQLGALPEDVYAVASPGDVLVVQGLVDVADEVDDELGGLGAQPDGHGGVEDLGGVVLDGGDDAALLLAVAVQVDGAAGRGRVLGVDEVEDACVVAPFGVADGVGPGGDVGEVVAGVVAEEALEVGLGLGLDEVAGYVGDGDVPEACAEVSE